MSTLERLFRYAKVSSGGDVRSVESRENYTTEALADAIRRDPRPILLALGRAGILGEHEVLHARAAAVTQWPMPGSPAERAVDSTPGDDQETAVSPPAVTSDRPTYGYIDMVLHLTIPIPEGPSGRETRREIWFENKVDAGISGGQLRNYTAYIEAHQQELRRDLVLLSREPIATGNVDLRQLRWQAVADAALDTYRPGDHWLDLRDYLQEIKMTEEWTLPVSAREAVALDDAFHLFRKALGVLEQVNRALDAPEHHALGYLPGFRWADRSVERACARQFSTRGRAMLYFGAGRSVWVFYGYEPIDGETYMTVWLEADPKHVDIRGQVRDWAARHESLANWQRPVEGWPVLKTAQRAILVDNTAEAVAWFVERVDELMGAGLYREIYPEKPAPIPAEDIEDPASPNTP